MSTISCHKMTRHAFVFALSFALLAGAGSAYAAEKALPVASPPQTQTTEDASALSQQARFVQNLGNQAISILADKTVPEETRATQFRNMLRESFDLQTIARFVIGRSWVTATPEQQTEYMDLFEKLVVKTYSDRFALYTGEGFKVRSSVPESDKDTVVNSDITHPDGSPATTVSWRVRTKGDKMGIIDVVFEGVSMSVTQRQEYASVIQRNGGNFAALLDLMRQRAAEQPAAPQQKG